MAQKKYASLGTLSIFLENLKNMFAKLGHTHTVSEITDYEVDAELSATSTNPVQNKVIDAEFEAVNTAMGALETAIDGKADVTHEHNDVYYTKSEIDNMEFITPDDIDTICGNTIEVDNGEVTF